MSRSVAGASTLCYGNQGYSSALPVTQGGTGGTALAAWELLAGGTALAAPTRKPKKQTKKKSPPKRALGKKSRQRPTLPHGFPCSTIGSEELNFRVRDGIGCGLLENTTGNLWIARPKRFRSTMQKGSGILAIRIPRANLKCALETWPSHTAY